MPATNPLSPVSTWVWWESRRLLFNAGLFMVGWLGFGIEVLASNLWSDQPMNPAYAVLWQGLVYVFYMVAANVLYLLGALTEGVLRPEPMDAFRRYAWGMGFAASLALPLIVAIIFAIGMSLPEHVG